MMICPICHHVLMRELNSYTCIHKHSFDIAKSGYVNLWPGNHKGSGDDKEMVKARTLFLNTGHYQLFQQTLIDLTTNLKPSVLADVGCGEGYYTNALENCLDACDVYGFDVSKSALQHASRQNSRIHYIIASLSDLPLSDESVDVITDVFAPVDAQSFHRVLKQDGFLIKVGPGRQHLLEMKQVLYDKVYENDDAVAEYDGFAHAKRIVKTQQIELTSNLEIRSLFQMTPYYWKSPKQSAGKLKAMDDLPLTTQFCFDIYKRK